MNKKQHLYLVFGGNLEKIGLENFSDVKSLEYVGIYESLKEAKKEWKSKSIKNIDYYSCDLNSPLAKIKADICDLPFENKYFDWVLCNHVLEHIKDDESAIKEIFRVLKPGGKAIMQVPLNKNLKKTFEDDTITKKEDRIRVFGQYDHLRVYGLDYFKKLQAVGFYVDKIKYGSKLSGDEIARYRVTKDEYIPLCTKTK